MNRLAILLLFICFCACNHEVSQGEVEFVNKDWRLDHIEIKGGKDISFQENIFVGISFLDNEQLLLTNRNPKIIKYNLDNDSISFQYPNKDSLYKARIDLNKDTLSLISGVETRKYILLKKASNKRSVSNVLLEGIRTEKDRLIEYKIVLSHRGFAEIDFSVLEKENGKEKELKKKIEIDKKMNSIIFDIASNINVPLESDTTKYTPHPDYKFMQLTLENGKLYKLAYYNLVDSYAAWLDELVVSYVVNDQI